MRILRTILNLLRFWLVCFIPNVPDKEGSEMQVLHGILSLITINELTSNHRNSVSRVIPHYMKSLV